MKSKVGIGHIPIARSIQWLGMPFHKMLSLLKEHFAIYKKTDQHMYSGAVAYCLNNARCPLNPFQGVSHRKTV